MKKVLVLGASGNTGRLLVQRLLEKGIAVIALVRDANSLKYLSDQQPELQIVEASISGLSETELATHIKGCDAVLSCLGHNLTFKGLFGHPRRLVTDAFRKVARAIEFLDSATTIKIILMNTTGNSNRDIPEKPPFSQRVVVGLLRLLLPPHADNENAADYLRLAIGQNNTTIEWVAVRPDGLINENKVSQYEVVPSPTRNVIFDAGTTSRINVADFMSKLVIDVNLWDRWKGKMPVIYNRT